MHVASESEETVIGSVPPRPWMRWAAAFGALCAALVILLGPRTAAAAPAPWCGELAQSIEAPPPVYPVDDATISAGPCEQRDGVKIPAPLPELRGNLKNVKSDQGVLFAQHFPRAPAVRLPVPVPTRNLARAGHQRGVERPPRS